MPQIKALQKSANPLGRECSSLTWAHLAPHRRGFSCVQAERPKAPSGETYSRAAYCLRPLFANAVIAASRVGS
jgi:hypothetical protein